jgi:hypothetical protein
MKILSMIGVTLALGGCVSTESQQKLLALQTQCNAGDTDACTAAAYQSQANQQEQQSALVAAGFGGGVLGTVVVNQGGGPAYRVVGGRVYRVGGPANRVGAPGNRVGTVPTNRTAVRRAPAQNAR